VDRNPRKIVFQKHAAARLGLTNVRFVSASVDTVKHDPALVGAYDAVVSRALSSDPSVIKQFSVFLKPAGLLVRMSGPARSAPAGKPEGFTEAAVWKGVLPFSSMQRTVTAYRRMSERYDNA
jgi:16S rRNA G527 N7-methylase RsmG